MFALMVNDSGLGPTTDSIPDAPAERVQYLTNLGLWVLDSYGWSGNLRTPRWTGGAKNASTRQWNGGYWVDDNPYTEDELLSMQQANKLEIKQANQRIDTVATGLNNSLATLATLTSASTSLQTQVNTVKAEISSSVKIAKVVTIVIPSGQTAATSALSGFNNVLAVLPVPMWVGNQMYLPGVTGSTNTSVSILGKRTKGTLVLSDGPCESTSGTFQVVVLGN